MNDTIKNWVIETGLRSVPTLKDRLIAEHGREAMAAAAAAGLGEELAAVVEGSSPPTQYIARFRFQIELQLPRIAL